MSIIRMSDFILKRRIIHLVKEIKTEKGVSYPTVKCGAKVDNHPTHEPTFEYTVWDSRITCVDCKPGLINL